MVRIRIGIVALGKGVNPTVIQEIRKEIRKTFDVPVEILEQKEIPLAAFNKFRDQYISDLLLEYLDKNVPAISLGVTNADLYTKGMNFIFGQAKLNRAAIVSFNRLTQTTGIRANDKQILDRVVKESIHELGHVLGLNHCKTKGCIMTEAINVKDVDVKGKEFCHMCSIQLK